MEMHIKFCPFNTKNELREIKDRLRERPYVSVTDNVCLNYCGQCIVQPFFIINGKLIACDGVNQLSTKLAEIFNERIDQNEKTDG